MWAGSWLSFLGKLRVGERIVRRSTIASVKVRDGASDRLVFVIVRHEIGNGIGAPAIVDEHDIVYRGLAGPAVKKNVPAAESGAWRRVQGGDQLGTGAPSCWRCGRIKSRSVASHLELKFVTLYATSFQAGCIDGERDGPTDDTSGLGAGGTRVSGRS